MESRKADFVKTAVKFKVLKNGEFQRPAEYQLSHVPCLYFKLVLLPVSDVNIEDHAKKKKCRVQVC
jgi:hypothetical protein